jgi:hypothetical protein
VVAGSGRQEFVAPKVRLKNNIIVFGFKERRPDLRRERVLDYPTPNVQLSRDAICASTWRNIMYTQDSRNHLVTATSGTGDARQDFVVREIGTPGVIRTPDHLVRSWRGRKSREG